MKLKCHYLNYIFTAVQKQTSLVAGVAGGVSAGVVVIVAVVIVIVFLRRKAVTYVLLNFNPTKSFVLGT